MDNSLFNSVDEDPIKNKLEKLAELGEKVKENKETTSADLRDRIEKIRTETHELVDFVFAKYFSQFLQRKRDEKNTATRNTRSLPDKFSYGLRETGLDIFDHTYFGFVVPALSLLDDVTSSLSGYSFQHLLGRRLRRDIERIRRYRNRD